MINKIREGHMNPLEVGAVQQAMPQEIIEHGAHTLEKVQLAIDRLQNERTTQGTHATGRSDSRKRSP